MLFNGAGLCASGTPCQINKILSHPTLPITITAQEDRHIKFFDNTSGKLIHSMVAHLDAVTSLAVDPNGLYLMSGSKLRFKCPLKRLGIAEALRAVRPWLIAAELMSPVVLHRS